MYLLTKKYIKDLSIMEAVLQSKYISYEGKIVNLVNNNAYKFDLTTNRKFFSLFVRLLRENVDDRPVLGERWQYFSAVPLVFFLDFAFVTRDADNISNYMAFVYIARIISATLKKLQKNGVIELVDEQFMGLMDKNIKENSMKCLLTISDGFVAMDKLYHVYLRVHFPFLRIVQEKALRFYNRVYNAIVQAMDEAQFMRYFNELDSVSWKEIIINPLLAGNEIIPMYGTNVNQENFLEKFVDVVDYRDEWDSEESITNFQQFFDLHKDHFRPAQIFDLFISKCAPFYSEKVESVQQIVPLMLDLAYGLESNYTFDYNEVSDDYEMDSSLYITRDVICEGSLWDSNVQLLKIFLGIIPATHWRDNITDWLTLGNVIYRTYHDANLSDEGLAMWEEITREKTNFDPEICRELYATRAMNYTVKTLAWIARETNYEDYQTSIFHWQIELIDKMQKFPNLERTVGELCYSLKWLDLISVKVEKCYIWKTFSNGRWHNVEETTLCNRISEQLTQLLLKYDNNLRVQRKQQSFQGQKDVKNNLYYYIGELEKITWVKKCLNWMRGLAFVADFDKYENSQENIVGFGERYLEIISDFIYSRLERDNKQPKGYIFARPGRPEDYVTMYSNVKLRDYTWENKEVKEVMEWMYKMFPDKELRNYVLKILARCLFSEGNADSIFPIFVSGGDMEHRGSEGKTTLKNLLDIVFGAYSYTPDSNVLSVNTRRAGSYNPSLTKAKGCKIVWINEISAHTVLDEGLVKQLTGGGEKVYLRKLHDNGDPQNIPYIPIMVCNEFPDLKMDSALKRRIHAIPFFSRFTANAPDDIDEQWKQRHFKLDISFKLRIGRLASAMLWILTQYYSLYFSERLPVPAIVREFSDNLWASRDIYLRFIRENYVISKDNSDSVDRNLLNEDFRMWLNSNSIPYKYLSTMLENLNHKMEFLGAILKDRTTYLGVKRR